MSGQRPSGQLSRPYRLFRRPAILAGAAAALLAATLGLSASGSAAPVAADRDRGVSRGTVIANLFQWNWRSIGRECTDVLGPAGYAGVQVSPPADSISRTAPNDDAPIVHPWWEVYQPVDYNLTSRFGNEAEFKQMVSDCRAAGVKVYADTVVNHMTGQGTVSYGGVSFTHFDYPDYDYADFHHTPADCPTAGGVDDFNNVLHVTKCELLGLADLRTDSPQVRAKIVGYLNKLISYGVSGFRVDAAKHIGQQDLAAIRAGLNRTLDGERPLFALEIYPGSPGSMSPFAFTEVGTPLGFDFAYQLKNAFKSYPTDAAGNITALRVFGTDAGLLPGDKSLVFVQNHDTERGSETLSYKDGARNLLAHYFMLSYGYGTPQVYSGFTFTNNYDSPPSTPDGYVTDTDCATGQWQCVNRHPGILGMVRFNNVVGNSRLGNWYDDSVNLIAFSRGSKGWIAINNDTEAKTYTMVTGLRSGTYCDVVHGSVSNGRCTGPTVTVGRHGKATVTVPARDAVAIDVADLVRR